jgi:hypothetical protein
MLELDHKPSITVRPAGDGRLCSNLAHTRLEIPASVMASFGRMPWLKWSDCSGRSFAFCPGCWDRTRTMAEQMVPGIEIRTQPADDASPAS